MRSSSKRASHSCRGNVYDVLISCDDSPQSFLFLRWENNPGRKNTLAKVLLLLLSSGVGSGEGGRERVHQSLLKTSQRGRGMQRKKSLLVSMLKNNGNGKIALSGCTCCCCCRYVFYVFCLYFFFFFLFLMFRGMFVPHIRHVAHLPWHFTGFFFFC